MANTKAMLDTAGITQFCPISGELEQFLANVNSLYVVRPSVCRLSVTFVHPTQAIEIFGNVSMKFGEGVGKMSA